MSTEMSMQKLDVALMTQLSSCHMNSVYQLLCMHTDCEQETRIGAKILFHGSFYLARDCYFLIQSTEVAATQNMP